MRRGGAFTAASCVGHEAGSAKVSHLQLRSAAQHATPWGSSIECRGLGTQAGLVVPGWRLACGWSPSPNGVRLQPWRGPPSLDTCPGLASDPGTRVLCRALAQHEWVPFLALTMHRSRFTAFDIVHHMGVDSIGAKVAVAGGGVVWRGVQAESAPKGRRSTILGCTTRTTTPVALEEALADFTFSCLGVRRLGGWGVHPCQWAQAGCRGLPLQLRNNVSNECAPHLVVGWHGHGWSRGGRRICLGAEARRPDVVSIAQVGNSDGDLGVKRGRPHAVDGACHMGTFSTRDLSLRVALPLGSVRAWSILAQQESLI